MEKTTGNIGETIKCLVDDIEKRVVDKILEPTNAELLKKLISNADSLDEAIAIAELGTTYKRTGFHFDKRLDVKCTNDIKYFKKNEDLSIHTDDGPIHKLIIGDNYEALQNLLIQYRGMVDVIYIDPPYGKDSMGVSAETNYQNAITRDNLLSMLYPRLVLAKQLLSKGGVIFCSIDDRNQAYIKCLFDEIFEERNFIATYLWKKTDTPPSLSKKVRKKYEYVLCYGNGVSKSHKFAQGKIDGGDAPLLNSGNAEKKITFPAGTVRFNIPDGTYSMNSNRKVQLHGSVVVKDGLNKNSFDATGPWKWNQETLDDEVKEGTYFLVKSEKFSVRFQRENTDSTKAPQNNINSELGVGTNEDGAKQIEKILKKDAFDNPKPVSLLNFLIEMVNMGDDITILDFFAGSGTTGHAVLDLNKQDGGKRSFILCQVNEINPTNPNGIALDVTTKRLKRVMTGECYDGSKNFKWAQENEPYGGNLDVYEIDSVANFEFTEGKTPFDVIDETLYGKEKFSTLQEKTEWVCSNFQNTQKVLREKGED